MNRKFKNYGIDREYLKRSKKSTPAQRLDWLAAAREFVIGTESARKKNQKQKRSTID